MVDPGLSFLAFARLVLDAVEAAGVEYLVGGSVGLWAWGESRTTQDFDLVINLPFEQIYRLSQELEKREMLVPFDVIVDLLMMDEGDLPVNAIHLSTGYKAELFLLRANDSYRRTALSRRLEVDLGPTIGMAFVHSPEDLIIYKLRYYQLSGQTKHMRDIQSILVAMGNELDYAYLDQWIKYFNLFSSWQTAQNWTGPA
jgi:hypothetical protein